MAGVSSKVLAHYSEGRMSVSLQVLCTPSKESYIELVLQCVSRAALKFQYVNRVVLIDV